MPGQVPLAHDVTAIAYGWRILRKRSAYQAEKRPRKLPLTAR